ncbi:hypothetical protein IPM62_01340 [Candidatus Woesebacteria bacterium]|nr:MAG: hypothetical protein IPM62_01340 [Candidatus Woesebacteria bacterium]
MAVSEHSCRDFRGSVGQKLPSCTGCGLRVIYDTEGGARLDGECPKLNKKEENQTPIIPRDRNRGNG